MISRTSESFRRDFALLPDRIKQLTRDAYGVFKVNPNHPSLKFKKLPPHEDIWSVRINNSYRAVGRWKDDTMVWFFIGSHADYDKLLARLD